MPNYLVDGQDLTAVADAIRAKGGTSDPLVFPNGFVSAIDAIPTGGGARSASGSFVLVNSSFPPVITHNLGTDKICGVIWPAGKITPNAGYQAWYLEFINVPALFSEAPTLELDFTNYNTHFDDITEVTMDDPAFWVGITHNSPWQTQSTWRSTANGGNSKGLSQFSITSTTFQVVGGQQFAPGEYNYIIWAIGD